MIIVHMSGSNSNKSNLGAFLAIYAISSTKKGTPTAKRFGSASEKWSKVKWPRVESPPRRCHNGDRSVSCYAHLTPPAGPTSEDRSKARSFGAPRLEIDGKPFKRNKNLMFWIWEAKHIWETENWSTFRKTRHLTNAKMLPPSATISLSAEAPGHQSLCFAEFQVFANQSGILTVMEWTS